jgi:hypothetical protein
MITFDFPTFTAAQIFSVRTKHPSRPIISGLVQSGNPRLDLKLGPDEGRRGQIELEALANQAPVIDDATNFRFARQDDPTAFLWTKFRADFVIFDEYRA